MNRLSNQRQLDAANRSSDTYSTLIEDVLGRIGLHRSTSRDPRLTVRAYERTCSFCDFSQSVSGRDLKMHSKSGPSVIERNSTVTASPLVRPWSSRAGHCRILVSQDEATRRGICLELRYLREAYSPPAEEFMDWHYEYLFKQPARN